MAGLDRKPIRKGLSMSRSAIFIVIFGILAVWLLVWLRWPAYQIQLVTRAGWILLVLAAWWLAGRVLAGK